MKVVLTNLSNKLYEESRFRLNESALKHGVHEINSYDFDDLKSTDFYQTHKRLLDQPRGLGYWIWKPYIILETLKNLSEDDVVIYSDCGIEIIKSLDSLVNICKDEEPVVLFANGNFQNRIWTKRDCFVFMNSDSREYWNGVHCDAAFSLFRKSDKSLQFLEEWLHYNCDQRIISDAPNVCNKKNIRGFREHRWDQSVLSLLAIKHTIPLFREPTQFGNHYKSPGFRIKGEFNCINQLDTWQVSYYSGKPYYNSPYLQLLDHHRSKNNKVDSVEKKLSRFTSMIQSANEKWRKIIHLVLKT